MTAATIDPLTVQQARALETTFLSGLAESQAAFEQIVESKAWTGLGFGTFAAWWDERVEPSMRSLSMRPSPDMARLAIATVREEERDLPSTQRSSQRDLAHMVGVNQKTVSNWERSTSEENSSTDDLGAEPALAEEEERLDPGTPKGQDLGDIITNGIDKFLSEQPSAKPEPARPQQDPAALERFKREQEERQSKEVFSKNLVQSVWYLAEFGGVVDAAERAIQNWQPSQDSLPFRTTAERMRRAADYLYALAERWPQ